MTSWEIFTGYTPCLYFWKNKFLSLSKMRKPGTKSANGKAVKKEIQEKQEPATKKETKDVRVKKASSTKKKAPVKQEPVKAEVPEPESQGVEKKKGLSKSGVRRLARRAGVMRFAKDPTTNETVYDEIEAVNKERLRSVLKDAVEYSACAGRKTVTVEDVKEALANKGQKLYGDYGI